MAEREPRESLAAILRLEPSAGAECAVSLESFWGEAAGGDALARAALFGAEANPGRDLVALHACFLASLAPDVPLQLHREALRGGGRISHLRVQLRDGKELLCDAALSFEVPGSDGPAYQQQGLPRDLPDPESLPSELELGQREGWAEYARGPIESRRIGAWREPVRDGEPARWRGWLRPRVALPDDPRLHMAALVFLSDYRIHWAVEKKLGDAFFSHSFVSLDHALWVHRPARFDDWWLVETTSEVARAGRSLTRREIRARDGSLIASVAQQALLRPL